MEVVPGVPGMTPQLEPLRWCNHCWLVGKSPTALQNDGLRQLG